MTRVTCNNYRTLIFYQEKKIVLNMDDLSSALAEYGVNAKKPDYYT